MRTINFFIISRKRSKIYKRSRWFCPHSRNDLLYFNIENIGARRHRRLPF